VPAPRQKRRNTRSRTGDEPLDAIIASFVAEIGPSDNSDLLHELAVTLAKLGRDGPDRGDLKLLSGAMRELRTSFRRFEAEADRPKASVFGSARTPPTDPSYELSREMGAKLAESGWMVITGGGPGIMTSTIEGAGGNNAFAVTIRLPFEPNPAMALVDDDHVVRFRYFFTRKLTFMKEASAYVVFPGGFGTMDELFELLTLMQTGKEMPAPVVLMDPDGETYWRRWAEFVNDELIENGWVSPEDMDLVFPTHSVDDAVAYIKAFYRGYHSLRFVEGRLVIRTQSPVTDGTLATLNEEFSDIIASGVIERTDALAHEIDDEDVVELPRLILDFDNRHFARLHRLARRISELA